MAAAIASVMGLPNYSRPARYQWDENSGKAAKPQRDSICFATLRLRVRFYALDGRSAGELRARRTIGRRAAADLDRNERNIVLLLDVASETLDGLPDRLEDLLRGSAVGLPDRLGQPLEAEQLVVGVHRLDDAVADQDQLVARLKLDRLLAVADSGPRAQRQAA